MAAEGCEVVFPSEKLSLLGLVEVLEHLPEVWGIRKHLFTRFKETRPDLFIGIDAPDFNLPLEEKLRACGIPTVHYVSPTVWAWRSYRIKRIKRAVDLMLTVFPFEADFYRQHQVPVQFVGHPLADMVPLVGDRLAARRELGLPVDQRIVAILPGSRKSELRYLSRPFLETAKWCHQRDPSIRFVAPMATPRMRTLFEKERASLGDVPNLTILDGHSRRVIEAADAVLLASGTATLESLLMKRPMVVAYRMAWLTQFLMRRLLQVPHFSLPNLLAGREVVHEYFQSEVKAEKLGPAVMAFLEDQQLTHDLQEIFAEIHYQLRRDAGNEAARAIFRLINQ